MTYLTQGLLSKHTQEKQYKPPHAQYCYTTMLSLLKKLFRFSPNLLNKHFNIIALLGKGGYGSVYHARRKSDLQDVALKKLKKNNYFIDTKEGRMPREIYISTLLNHPNIIPSSSFIKTSSYWVLIMGYNKLNIDLHTYISSRGILSEPLASSITEQTMSALAYCFKNGVTHGDIKPDNILINTQTLQIQLIDFGAATFYTKGHKVSLTGMQGTDVFLPAELFETLSYLPTEGTVWAVGCLAFCMVTGCLPFQTRQDVLYLDLTTTLPKALTSLCRNFILRCLDRNCKRRISFREMRRHQWCKRDRIML